MYGMMPAVQIHRRSEAGFVDCPTCHCGRLTDYNSCSSVSWPRQKCCSQPIMWGHDSTPYCSRFWNKDAEGWLRLQRCIPPLTMEVAHCLSDKIEVVAEFVIPSHKKSAIREWRQHQQLDRIHWGLPCWHPDWGHMNVQLILQLLDQISLLQ